MPTIGQGGNLHPTMGTGALLSTTTSSPQHNATSKGARSPAPTRSSFASDKAADPTAALHSLQQINDTINTPKGGGGDQAGGVTGVLRPAEIVNYRVDGHHTGAARRDPRRRRHRGTRTHAHRIRTTTATRTRPAQDSRLHAPTTRRGRRLASRPSPSPSASQSAIPLGIIAGRSLWNPFARAIHAVPEPTVPALSLVLIALGALVLANLVAVIPGLQAARTQTAALLHSE